MSFRNHFLILILLNTNFRLCFKGFNISKSLQPSSFKNVNIYAEEKQLNLSKNSFSFDRNFLLLKACARYFSLFLKEKCMSSLFRTKYIQKNLTYSCFFFPSLHEHSFSLELPRPARLLKTSCFEKTTVCVIETMLMT